MGKTPDQPKVKLIFSHISRPQPREKSSENKKESWFDKILRKKPQKEVHTSFKVRDIMQFTIFLRNSWIFSQG
jgi:hypothetical protein